MNCADDAAQITFVFEDGSGDANCRARRCDTRPAPVDSQYYGPPWIIAPLTNTKKRIRWLRRTPVQLYFDTNVYSMIGERGDAAATRKYFSGCAHAVLASAFNLLELRSIPVASTMSRDLGALRRVARTYEEYPLPYRHAREVLTEIRRVHPEWLRHTAPQNKIRSFLRHHHEEWREFKQDLPPRQSIAVYRAAAEPGNAINRQVQKLMRAQQSISEGDLYLVTPSTIHAILRGIVLSFDILEYSTLQRGQIGAA